LESIINGLDSHGADYLPIKDIRFKPEFSNIGFEKPYSADYEG